MAPRAVLMKTGLKSVNTARPVNTVRPSYTAHPKSTIHCARPMTYFQNQAQSTVHRPFSKRTAFTKRCFNQKFDTGRPFRSTVNTVKASACWVWMPKNRVVDHGRKIDLINEDHFCLDGCINSREAKVQQRKKLIQRRVQQKQKDQEDEVFGRILSAKKMKITAAGEKVNAAESLLVVSTEEDNHQEELYIHKEEMAPMALSNSKVNNDESCSKTCLTNYEALKKQYDDFLVKLDDTGFKAASILKGQILKYKEHEVLFSKEIVLLKRSEVTKNIKWDYLGLNLKSRITDKSKKGFGYNVVPSPHPLILNRPTPLDLSYLGLKEFKEPKVNEYGPRDSSLKPTTGCDKESDNSKENTDDSLKQQQKTDSKTSSVKSPIKVDKDWKEKFFCPTNHVREEEPKKARENNDAPIIKDWVSDDEDEVEPIPKACFICGNFDHIQYSCPKTAHSSAHKHMAPRAVLMKTGLKSVNTGKSVSYCRSCLTLFALSLNSIFVATLFMIIRFILPQSALRREYLFVQEEGKLFPSSNYEFWLQEVRFLRHVVNNNDIYVDSSKIEAIKN
ncbi:hypothetical protein Tco_0600177 [Tanacetum coccineum]|uniref:CCHC-type domain-containing protein n=1 Tax=Tanacetum coccineum TaxID=301880 RepID=A0ABQ4WB15_9ASTR